MTFSPNRDASSSFTINLFKDNPYVNEGDEFFFLSFQFKEATGDFYGAFRYQDSATNQDSKCTIKDTAAVDGIVMI